MFAIFTAFVLFVSAPAHAAPNHSDSHFNEGMRALLLRCAIQPYAVAANGHRVNGNIRSVCRELEVFKQTARLEIEGKHYFAHLYDSEFSDSGDLNNIRIVREDGAEIVFNTDILAYGDIVLALNDGRDTFREIYDSSLLDQL